MATVEYAFETYAPVAFAMRRATKPVKPNPRRGDGDTVAVGVLVIDELEDSVGVVVLDAEVDAVTDVVGDTDGVTDGEGVLVSEPTVCVAVCEAVYDADADAELVRLDVGDDDAVTLDVEDSDEVAVDVDERVLVLVDDDVAVGVGLADNGTAASPRH